MTVHINGSKGKELYYNGVKIKEAYYNGNKVYSSGPLYYCYTGYGLYCYFQIPMTYVGQSQSHKSKSEYDASQVSSSSQLTYTSIPHVVETITSNGFTEADPIYNYSLEFTRYQAGDLYT